MDFRTLLASKNVTSPTSGPVFDAIVHKVLAPYLAGLVLQMFMMGILTLQTWNYFRYFHNDFKLYKALVAALFVAGAVQSSTDFQILYNTFVTGYGNLDVFRNYGWTLYYEPAWTGMIVAMSQTFFLYRCYSVTKSILIVVAGAVGILTGVGSSIAMSYGLSQYQTSLPQDTVWLITCAGMLSALSSDGVAIYALTPSHRLFPLGYSYLAFIPSKDGLPINGTEKLIMRVIRLSFETAVFTSCLAIADLALSMAFSVLENGAHFVFQFSMGKAYSHSVLVTLLARQNLSKEGSGVYSSSGGPNRQLTSGGVVVTTTRVRVTDDFKDPDRVHIPMNNLHGSEEVSISDHRDQDKISRIA